MLQYINVKNVWPHPDNPRKDLGDLTELTESIRANGIFQNLTVVPWISKITGQPGDNGSTKDKYTVVIGHRRLEAAKLAGLEEVPCIIAEMTIPEQISTMLLENMQRTDLTVYEQACGFQMMFDWGETVKSIAEKTGFAETTIKHRMKLTELDKDALEKAAKSGATINDYIELEKIKDIKTRNRVLQSIGTKNFAWELKNAVDNEVTTTNKQRVLDIIKSFATKVELYDYQIHERVLCFYGFDDKTEIEVPEDAETTEYFYRESYYIELYKKRTDTIEQPTSDPEWLIKQRATDAKRESLREVSGRMYRIRYEFIRDFTGAKKYIPVILKYLFFCGIEEISDENAADLLELVGLEDDSENQESIFIEAMEIQEKQPEKCALSAVYNIFGDCQNNDFYDWNNRYEKNLRLDALYKMLVELGYQIAEEEQQMIDGTHELYEKAE